MTKRSEGRIAPRAVTEVFGSAFRVYGFTRRTSTPVELNRNRCLIENRVEHWRVLLGQLDELFLLRLRDVRVDFEVGSSEKQKSEGISPRSFFEAVQCPAALSSSPKLQSPWILPLPWTPLPWISPWTRRSSRGAAQSTCRPPRQKTDHAVLLCPQYWVHSRIDPC